MITEEKNITALIVGDGTQKERLQSLSEELRIDDKVIFTGYQKDVSEVLNVIDINVLTSKNEALSLSLIEGMFLEKPAISTASGGPCEVIDDGVTGLIVENDNEKALSDAILTLIKDRELQNRMGKNGRKRAEEIFTLDKMIKNLDEIYIELINKK